MSTRHTISGDKSRPLRESCSFYKNDIYQLTRQTSSAVTATALYLSNYKLTNPSLLAPAAPNIIAPTFIDPSATIDPSAKIGPNVAIGPNVTVGPGVRIKDAIVLEGSTLEKHSCALNSIVGTNSHIGAWSRVDGEQEFEREVKGKISVTILASEVSLAPETMVRSCIVLPNVRLHFFFGIYRLTVLQKTLTKNATNQVLL